MPRNPTNRIEVDLKLLQDRNIEKLQKFGDDFNKSVGTLATLIGSWDEQIRGARDINKPGTPGPDASVASSVRIDSVPARRGGFSRRGVFSGGFANLGGGGTGYGGGGGGSVSGPDGVISPGGFEQQYVQATKRIGALPVGFRQTLGYLAEGGFGKTPEWTAPMDAQGNITYRDPDTGQVVTKQAPIGRRGASRLNDFMFQTQAIKANMLLGAGKVQGFFGTQQAYTSLGQTLGRSREGGFLGIGSSAWTTGVAEQFKTGLAADFGFSPYYSLKQAQEARATLQGYGYSGDTSDRLASMLKELQIHQGINSQSAMTILDPFMRFGGPESLGQLTAILKEIPNAAYAAKMNLQQFTEELASTAQQVSQTTGMTVGNAARGLSAFSAVTGLAPQRAASIMTDPTAAWMAVGLTHSNLWDVTNGPNALSDRFKIFQARFDQVTGMSTGQLLDLAKHNHAAFATVMSRVQALYMQDPNFFGGLSPREWLNAQVRNQGKTVGHIAINEDITHAGSTARMDRLLKDWGGPAGANMSKQFEIWEAKHPLSDAKSPMTHANAARAFAESLIKQQERNAAGKAANRITIALTPDAARLLKLVPSDTSQRNSGESFSRKAIGYGKDVLSVAEDAGKIASFLP